MHASDTRRSGTPQSAEAEKRRPTGPETRSLEPSILDRAPSGGWQLVGRRCSDCGETLFGRKDRACPRCAGTGLGDVALAGTGRLYAFTVLRNPPPGNRRSDFPSLPCGLGLVELDGGGPRIAAPLTVPVERLAIGLPLALLVFELYTDDDGRGVAGFAFEESA